MPSKDRIRGFAFADNNITVCGIKYPVSIFSFFKNPKKVFTFLKSNFEINENQIISYTPFVFLPINIVNKYRFLLFIHKYLLTFQIKSLLKKINSKANVISWITRLEAFPLFTDLNINHIITYNCLDDLTRCSKTGNLIQNNFIIEQNIFKKANIVFTSSWELYKSKSIHIKKCYYIPLGVDYNFFSNNNCSSYKGLNFLSSIKKPIASYIGTFRDWIDLNLLHDLIIKNKNISFVFAGPVLNNAKETALIFSKYDNVFFLGEKSKDEVLFIIQNSEICLMPFKMHKFNDASNPLKFWEYMAAGKKILCSNIAELRRYKDIVQLYNNNEEALLKLNNISKETYFNTAKQIRIAKNHDWNNLFKRQHKIIAKSFDL